ncbi:uncharacterized protein LOC124354514 [Homalodisca vitripennis]|nr:uncharacterized protein LOC124354514 [Homalodisca vitripennis]
MSTMGNKSSLMALKFSDYFGLQGISIRQSISDDDYHLMSLEMKKVLLGRKKFRHVLPNKKVEESTDEIVEAIKTESGQEVQNEKAPKNEKEKSEERLPPEDDWEEPALNMKIEPVVTVVNMASVASRPLHDPREENHSSCGDKSVTSKSSPAPSPRLFKSRQPTNRKYSVIDIKTGLRKSKFTLELEEKLRQSKLELGFDTDLEDWREFTYKVEKPELKRQDIVNKGPVESPEDEATERKNEKIFPHNCQVLGLCSIERNEDLQKKFQNVNPSVCKDEISREYSLVNLDSGNPEPAKRDICDCDVCTLSYLTGMGFPSHCENLMEKRRALDETNKLDKDRNDRIQILDVKDLSRSIKVSVFNNEFSDLSYSSPSITSASYDGDCTNLKIKKMFENNTRERHGGTEINNGYLTYNEIPTFGNCLQTDHPNTITNFPPCEKSNESPDQWVRRSRRTTVLGNYSSKMNYRFPSTSTTGASFSSSLSTILSYRRVRQIFQNFIEKNCSKKKVRRNINKFKEMEELGLGEVKNNRWYPSGTKTVSIWNDIHSNVRGCQAEFKKFPKMSSMPLK